MNYRLLISKRKVPAGTRIRFIVVDLDKSDRFPQNYVCMLPKYEGFTKTTRRDGFLKLFGENSRDVAIALLSDSLRRERDLEVKADIKERLRLLNKIEPAKIKEFE